MDNQSHNLLYSIRGRRLPADKLLSLYDFCLQEVMSFRRVTGYLPSKILVRKDDYEKLIQEVAANVVIRGIEIPIVAASAIQLHTIQLYPVIKMRLPLIYKTTRSPQ